MLRRLQPKPIHKKISRNRSLRKKPTPAGNQGYWKLKTIGFAPNSFLKLKP